MLLPRPPSALLVTLMARLVFSRGQTSAVDAHAGASVAEFPLVGPGSELSSVSRALKFEQYRDLSAGCDERIWRLV